MDAGTPSSIPELDNGNHNANVQEDWDELFSKTMTATDVASATFPELRWVVDDLIPEGLSVFAGQSKIGKSWFLLQMALSVTSGSEFLGAFSTNQAAALYIALEDTPRRMKNRMASLGMPVSKELAFLHEWRGGSDALAYYLEQNPNVKVVIIDTWGKYLAKSGKRGSDYLGTTNLADELHDIAKNRNVAIIACTHIRKVRSKDDWCDDIIGSKALPSVADTIIKLTRERNSTFGTLNISGRDVCEQDVSVERSDNWQWSVSASCGFAESLTDGQRKILSYLERNPGFHPTRKLQQRIGGYSVKGGADLLENDLLKLYKLGIVTRQGDSWAFLGSAA